jgi:hypothetical protein
MGKFPHPLIILKDRGSGISPGIKASHSISGAKHKPVKQYIYICTLN